MNKESLKDFFYKSKVLWHIGRAADESRPGPTLRRDADPGPGVVVGRSGAGGAIEGRSSTTLCVA